MDNKAKVIITHLELLSTGEIDPFNVYLGLCHELEEHGVESVDFSDWPGHSGEEEYPVLGGFDEFYAYKRNTRSMWGDNGYGRKRRELCGWLSAQLKEGALGLVTSKEGYTYIKRVKK